MNSAPIAQQARSALAQSAPLAAAECRRARLSRDPRFDGLFFIAVKTTGIFCRPICPAVPPREANVEYFNHAAKAFLAGYRPCLRCRPDSAPGSCAWRGTDTTFTRALMLIDAGALQHAGLPELSARLGISDRYLRRLFQQRLGLSPKAYALFGQVMFAKKLLHETTLSVNAIADAAGFNSLRRFNDAFVKHLQFAPTSIRRSQKSSSMLKLTLAYRPPLDWAAMLGFWQRRCIAGVEWVSGMSYGRTFYLRDSNNGAEAKGMFEVEPLRDVHALQLRVQIGNPRMLKALVARVRQVLDLDADLNLIEEHLNAVPGFSGIVKSGFRIPGIWHPFEAGVRAILGQQVSVAAARTHLERLVAELAEPVCAQSMMSEAGEVPQTRYYFPTPEAIAANDLEMLKMPASRRATLKGFAEWYAQFGEQQSIASWVKLKGIGPWTVAYAQMRAHGDTDIWLAGDLGIKKALVHLNNGDAVERKGFDSNQLKPWRSYATFHLWNYLG